MSEVYRGERGPTGDLGPTGPRGVEGGVTWKWAVGVFLAATMAFGGWVWKDLDAITKRNRDDIAQIQTTLAVIQYQYTTIHGELVDIKAQLRVIERGPPGSR